MGLGVAKIFAWFAKISHSDRNDFVGVGLISLGVRIWFTWCAKFRTLCELSYVFRMPCENFLVSPLFEIP